MTRKELFNKIWSLPNFPYRYQNEQDNKDYYALLGYSGSNQPVPFSPSNDITPILDDMIDIYAKKGFSENDKSFLAGSMHKLQNMCGYRFEKARTKNEHEEFINNLSEENFISICKQVEMYIFARKLYSEGYR